MADDEEGVEGTVVWRTPLATGTFPCQRGGHTAVLCGHRLVVFGGHFHKGEGKFEYLNDVNVLNLETLRWRSKKCEGDIPKARYGHSATGAACAVRAIRNAPNRSLRLPLTSVVLRRTVQCTETPCTCSAAAAPEARCWLSGPRATRL